MCASAWDRDTPQNEQLLARQLVQLVLGTGREPATIKVEYKGAIWEVGIRLVQPKDTSMDRDFMERLPE